MKRVLLAALAWLALTCAAFAQITLVPGDTGAPKYGPPGPWCFADMPSFMANEGGSSGDGHSGWEYSWDVANQCFSLRPPALLTGNGAIATSNINLTQNAFTFLDGSVGAGGFRPNLAQYPPQGTYIIHGAVSFATAVTNSSYEVEITAGTTAGSGSQSLMLAGSPSQIGGGACTSSGASSVPFQCSFITPRFYCAAPYGWACEIRIGVFTSDAAGAALATTTHLTSTHVSSVWLERVRGLDSLQ